MQDTLKVLRLRSSIGKPKVIQVFPLQGQENGIQTRNFLVQTCIETPKSRLLHVNEAVQRFDSFQQFLVTTGLLENGLILASKIMESAVAATASSPLPRA